MTPSPAVICVGIGYFIGLGRVDAGRHHGLAQLAASPFTLTGKYNDDPQGRAVSTQHVTREHRNWGEFRTPSLRNVALTAPYMHNGKLASLPELVRHYSKLDPDRLHQNGEKLLRLLQLRATEEQNLVALLRTLTSPQTAYTRRGSTRPRCN